VAETLACAGCSRREDYPEFGFPAHHARVSFGRLCERELFDHGALARHLREDQRVLGVGGDAARPALDAFASKSPSLMTSAQFP
jgi:hypothetical protein